MNKDNNILYFRQKPENAEDNLKKHFKLDKTQAQNLSIILSECIRNNDFSILYDYLISEITSRGSFTDFCANIKTNPRVVRKFFQSHNTPDIVFLSKVLNGLGFNLTIKTKLV